MADILEAAETLPEKAGPGQSEKRLAGLFPSNAEERRVVIRTLGFAGILQDPSHPGFLDGFVNADDRPESSEWEYRLQEVRRWTSGRVRRGRPVGND